MRKKIAAAFLVSAFILAFFLWDDLLRLLVNPVFWLVLLFAGIIPLVLLLENWRTVVNPFIELGYDLFFWRRRRKYLPPEIKMEGLGSNRSLTLAEVLVLHEAPLEDVLALILSEVIEQKAVRILSENPPRFEVESLLPKNLLRYQKDFCRALEEKNETQRHEKLSKLVEHLVQITVAKMRWYSLKETLAYYQNQLNVVYQEEPFLRYLQLAVWLVRDEKTFTEMVVERTYPLPAVPVFKEPPSYMRIHSGGSLHFRPHGSRGGGSGCACAGCACAGCACACAGGGR
ncbi:MAG: hypothetical protein OHK0031_01970 [Anaerolineales bacterium]